MAARPRRTNLGDAPPLVGRAIDLAALGSIFDEGARLVSVVGPGGIGKTSLATALARRVDDDGGAWFCDLTTASSVADLCSTLASVLDVKLRGARDPGKLVDQIGLALARRGRILLVLDNFEQLVASAAATVAQLIAVAPSARFLVTTRVALGLAGEYRWPLQGLEEAESVDLFLRRARQIRPDLTVDAATRRAAARIAARLEGIPLALELAASRVAVLSPSQIFDRLGDGVLARTSDEGRHGSMRAVVADSIRLLGDAERACLAGCAVFEGGFTLEAASAVLAGGGDAVAILERLVAHSLLRVLPGEEPRFVLYEVVRELLEPAGEAAHAAYFTTLARSRRPAELRNLIRAHVTVCAAGDVEAALALAQAIHPVLLSRGLLALRLEVLDRTLALVRHPRTLVARAHTYAELGEIESATRDLDEALDLASGDRAAEALVHARLGAIVETSGDTAAARAHFATALSGHADRETEAEARAALGHAYRREGRLDEAEREVLAVIAVYRELGDDEGLAASVFEAGVLDLFRMRYEDATRRFDEALAVATRIDARQRQASIHTARGTMEQELGAVDRARELHEAAVAMFRDAGKPYAEASTLYYLGGALLEAGQRDDAGAVWSKALRLVRTVGVRRYEALILGALAVIRPRAEGLHLLDQADTIASTACRSEPALLATLAVHRKHVQGARIDEARALAASHACDDPRFALRIFEQHARPRTGLVVRAGGRAFRLPEAETDVDLARRLPLGRILFTLAQHRVGSPGDGLRVEDILAAGWPDERVRYDAGANRVYVALAELRKLGLRDWIVSDAEGYRLATSRAVVLESA